MYLYSGKLIFCIVTFIMIKKNKSANVLEERQTCAIPDVCKCI